MGSFISDRFLYDGTTKQMLLRYVSATIPYTSEAKFIIVKFSLEGDIANIDVVLRDKYFQSPIMTGSKLIKEDGRWKWYGNQIAK